MRRGEAAEGAVRAAYSAGSQIELEHHNRERAATAILFVNLVETNPSQKAEEIAGIEAQADFSSMAVACSCTGGGCCVCYIGGVWFGLRSSGVSLPVFAAGVVGGADCGAGSGKAACAVDPDGDGGVLRGDVVAFPECGRSEEHGTVAFIRAELSAARTGRTATGRATEACGVGWMGVGGLGDDDVPGLRSFECAGWACSISYWWEVCGDSLPCSVCHAACGPVVCG